MNPSSTANDHISLLSEPIGPVHESDLVSLPPRDATSEPLRYYHQDEVKEQIGRFVWNEWDVPIGRGRVAREFVGNEKYRDLIKQYRPSYLAAAKRKDKRDVSVTIYNIIKSNGGRFLAPNDKQSGSWFQISKDKALAKIGQALRIGVRSPQFVSSSWTYPIDSEDRRQNFSSQSFESSHPLFVHLPRSASDSYWEGQASLVSDYGDRLSNLSLLSDDQPSPSPYQELESQNNPIDWNNSSAFDPFPI